jgi:hypothetical protein
VIRENRPLTVCEAFEEVGFSKSSFHTIFVEKLELHHAVAKFVPLLMTVEQKVNHVTVNQKVSEHSNPDETFCKVS